MNISLIILAVILILFLIALSAGFSFAEIALASSSQIRLKLLEKKGSHSETKQAKRVINFLDNYNQISTTIVILNNVVNILATTISAAIFNRVFLDNDVLSVIMSFLVMTFLIIIFGELIPKMLAKKYPESGIMKFSFSLVILSLMLKPITYFLQFIVKQENMSPIKSEDELKEAISQAEAIGITSKQEQKIIDAALKFDDTLVKNIMVKKPQVGYIYYSNTQDEIVEKLKRSDHTRLPVLDSYNRVIYILNARRYLTDYLDDNSVKFDDHLFPFQSFPKNTPVQKILNSLKVKRQKLAIIEGEKNKFLGIITIEDIIEVLVGKMYDEFDVEQDGIYFVEEKTFLVKPSVKVFYFFDKYLSSNYENFKISKKISFYDWVKSLAKKNEINIGEQFIFKNLIIWVKKDNYSEENIIFEVDIL